MVVSTVRTTLFTAFVSLGFAGAAIAQTGTSQAPAGTRAQATDQATGSTGKSSKSYPVPRSRLSHSDREFVKDAYQGGLAEVELGKLAAQHSSNDQVKQFGERMVSDHGKAGEQIRELAQAKGVTLPEKPKHSASREMGKLAKLNGADFDRQYIDYMVKDHQKVVKAFQKEAQKGKDADVKGFAQQTLPTLQEHLSMAQAAQSAVGGGKSGGKPKADDKNAPR